MSSLRRAKSLPEGVYDEIVTERVAAEVAKLRPGQATLQAITDGSGQKRLDQPQVRRSE